MKIGIIGSTGYYSKMVEHKEKLEKCGHEVRLPLFDGMDPSTPNVELLINLFNREVVEWAEILHVFYDARSAWSLFDFGMAFMARKPIKIIHLERKTVGNFLTQYEKSCENELVDLPETKE